MGLKGGVKLRAFVILGERGSAIRMKATGSHLHVDPPPGEKESVQCEPGGR